MSRRILASLMIIGLVGVGLGSTTMAMFNDSETSSDNQFTAGELDLRIDWEESYNGEQIETQNLTNDPGAIFDFEDLKPGDHGEATISLHLEDNPGWVWMNLNQTSNWDNACTEPERAAEGQCGSTGELDEELEFVIWADDGDNVLQDDENVIFEGTADELEDQSSEGVFLDGNPSTEQIDAFEGEETGYIGVKWNLPLETGNHIQGDSVSYDVSFYTEQERHNENPDNPWESDNETEEPVGPEPEPEPISADNIRLTAMCTDEQDNLSQFRIRNSNEQEVTVSYDVYQETNKTEITVGAESEEFVEVPASEGDATVRMFYNNSQIDVKANNPSECDLGEPNEVLEPSGNLTFNDQMVDDGQVTINNVSTTVGSTVFVTYEDGNDTVIAGIRNAPANLDNFDPYTVDVEGSGVPGEHTARMMEKPIAFGYSPGDVLQESTLEKQYFSQSAQITAEEETEFTATQGDTTVELEPIEGDETAKEFYDFRLPDRYDNEASRNATNGASFPGNGPYYGSAGTEDLQTGDTSLMFLYEGPEGLSFVVVHEGDGSDDGGSATFEITDLNGNGEWVVKDDYYLDSDGTIASSNYDRWNTSSNPQTIDWTWGGGGSDGGVFQPLSENFTFTISPAFNEEAGLYDDNFYDGEVDEWQVLSGDRNNPDRTTLDMEEEVTVTAN